MTQPSSNNESAQSCTIDYQIKGRSRARRMLMLATVLLLSAAPWGFSRGLLWPGKEGCQFDYWSKWLDQKLDAHLRLITLELEDGGFGVHVFHEWRSPEADVYAAPKDPAGARQWRFSILDADASLDFGPYDSNPSWAPDDPQRSVVLAASTAGFALHIIRASVPAETRMPDGRSPLRYNVTNIVIPLWLPFLLALIWVARRLHRARQQTTRIAAD